MSGTMAAKRPRMLIDVSERYRRAFHIWAAKRGHSVPEAFAALIELHAPEELAIADQQLIAEGKPPPPPSPKGKPRKGG